MFQISPKSGGKLPSYGLLGIAKMVAVVILFPVGTAGFYIWWTCHFVLVFPVSLKSPYERPNCGVFEFCKPFGESHIVFAKNSAVLTFYLCWQFHPNRLVNGRVRAFFSTEYYRCWGVGAEAGHRPTYKNVHLKNQI